LAQPTTNLIPGTATPDTSALPVRPWVAVVGNPFSGSGANAEKVARLEGLLRGHGLTCVTIWDRAERLRVLNHPDLARWCVCIVAAGGDGTVSDVFNHTHSVPLAVLPLGTENLLAKYLGFTDGPEALGLAIFAGRHRSIDLGRWRRSASAGSPGEPGEPGAPGVPSEPGRFFSLMVSAGVDAHVVHSLAAWRTNTADGSLRRVRRFTYLRPTAASFWRYTYPPVILEADGRRHEGVLAMAFNVPRYALNLPFITHGDDADGKFDWVLFRHGGPSASIGYLTSVIRNAHHERSDVVWGRAANIRLISGSDAAVPLQSDGDPIGHAPVELSVLPKAIRVVCTKHAPR
jgi:diacylglycerol kinase (ATP)